METLLDNNGEAVNVHAFARKGSFSSNRDFIDFSIEYLGFISMDLRQGSCLVRINPKRVARRAEAALFFALRETSPKRVLVSLVQRDAIPQIYPGASEGIAGISGILQVYRSTSRQPYVSRPFDVSVVGAPAPFSSVLATYRATQSFRRMSRWDLLARQLKGRFLIVERLRKRDALVVRVLGRGYGVYRDWFPPPSEICIDEQPDLDYGTWLAGGYHHALDNMTAQAEEVDAIIYRPKYGRRRFGYRRLVLPFRLQRRVLLLSTSVLDPAVDLGIEQRAEASDVVDELI